MLTEGVADPVTYTDVRFVIAGSTARLFDSNSNVVATIAEFDYDQPSDDVMVLTAGDTSWEVTRRRGCCGG